MHWYCWAILVSVWAILSVLLVVFFRGAYAYKQEKDVYWD